MSSVMSSPRFLINRGFGSESGTFPGPLITTLVPEKPEFGFASSSKTSQLFEKPATVVSVWSQAKFPGTMETPKFGFPKLNEKTVESDRAKEESTTESRKVSVTLFVSPGKVAVKTAPVKGLVKETVLVEGASEKVWVVTRFLATSAPLKLPSAQTPPSVVPAPVLSVTMVLPVEKLNSIRLFVEASPTQKVVSGLKASRVKACRLVFCLNLKTCTDVITPLAAVSSLALP